MANTQNADKQVERARVWASNLIMQYENSIKQLKKMNFSDDIKNIILKIANSQDKKYDTSFKDKNKLDDTHNDDLFMLMFLAKNKGIDKLKADDDDALQLIHSGWGLSRLRIIGGLGQIEKYMESAGAGEDKQLINIGDAYIQKRRVPQFTNEITQEEKDNDKPFLNNVISLNASEKEQLQNFFDPIVWPKIAGGKNIKSSKKQTSEKIIIKGKSRIVYQGPKGGRYIKSGGLFIAIK